MGVIYKCPSDPCIRLGIFETQTLIINATWTLIPNYSQIISGLSNANIYFLNGFNANRPYPLNAVDEGGSIIQLYVYMSGNNLYLETTTTTITLDISTVILSNTNNCNCLTLFFNFFDPSKVGTFPANQTTIVPSSTIRHFDSDLQACLLGKRIYFKWYSVDLVTLGQTLIAYAYVTYDGTNLSVTPNKTVVADNGAFVLENFNCGC